MIASEIIDYGEKDKSRGLRRKRDRAKARRTMRHAEINYGEEYVSEQPFGRWVKGKAYCSCAMCKPKTNHLKNKGVKYSGHAFSKTFRGMQWKHSDVLKIQSKESELKEYTNEGLEYLYELPDVNSMYPEYLIDYMTYDALITRLIYERMFKHGKN